jgi:hypothetical protein
MGASNSSFEGCSGTRIYDERFGGRIDVVTRMKKTYVVKTVTVTSE